MQRYKITVEYFGPYFSGWQRQRDCVSVQESIEDAIFQFTKEHACVYGAGRTDSGVHALQQAAHFDLNKKCAPNKVVTAINHFIRPRPVSIVACEEVENSFHARFSARKRHYVYKIVNRQSEPIIDENRVWWIQKILNVENMRKAASSLVGVHDFSSFRTTQCQALSPVKTLENIVIKENEYCIDIFFSAPSFLHRMVRNIVGTLVMIGLEKLDHREIIDILNHKNRSKAGPTAPPQGLYLLRVEY